MEVNEVINGAIKVLETDGWIQGHYTNGKSYCVLGALYKSAGYDYATNHLVGGDGIIDIDGLVDNARKKIASCLKIKDKDYLITLWNDDEGRTVEEVIDTLKCALEK